MYELTLDYETKSEADLPQVGTINYARHPTTTLLSCYATLAKVKFKRGKKKIQPIKGLLHIPGLNDSKFAKFLKKSFALGATLHAHNWVFEYWISREVGIKQFNYPKAMLDPSLYFCTAAKSLANGLPAKLETVTRFLGITEKDAAGHRVMLQCCKPRRPKKDEDPSKVWWFDDEVRLKKVYDYNKIDVEAEIHLDKTLMEIHAPDMPLFRLDQQINLKGVRVDMDLINGAIKIINKNEKFNYGCLDDDYKDYFETLNQHLKVKQYLNEACLYFPENLQKETLLDEYENNFDNIPVKARECVRARLELGSAAVKKYFKFKAEAVLGKDLNYYVYHTLQYCGAAATGRWAGRGVQLHNMPRGVVPQALLEIGRGIVKAGKFKTVKRYCDRFGVAVTDWLAALCRSILIPRPGHAFVVNDYASVEAGGVMFLADCQGGLDMFNAKTPGQGPYEQMAAKIFNIDINGVTKDQRFVGKQAILGCIAEGQKVLTDVGLIPIEDVQLWHKVWDGQEWVGHDGAIFKGVQAVKEYQGLTATYDHKVYTVNGEIKMFEECIDAENTIEITGNGRQAIRVCKDYKVQIEEGKRLQENESTVSGVRDKKVDKLGQYAVRENQRMSTVQSRETATRMVIQSARSCKTALREYKQCKLLSLWGAWDSVQFQFSSGGYFVCATDTWTEATLGTGSNRQRRSLRTREHSLCNTKDTSDLYGRLFNTFFKRRQEPQKDIPKMVRVYDILNAGPRHRFTVSNVLVSNCGYGMGVPRFIDQCDKYGQTVLHSLGKKTVYAYRDTFSEVTDLWKHLDKVFIECFDAKRKGVRFTVNRHLSFEYIGNRNVVMWLPSGRYIKYNKCSVGAEDTISYYKNKDGRMFKNTIWGGHFLENACQAMCRDLLATAMLELDVKAHSIVLTVHDELINEVPIKGVHKAFKAIQKIVTKVPRWAKGFPMGVDGKILTQHYEKI